MRREQVGVLAPDQADRRMVQGIEVARPIGEQEPDRHHESETEDKRKHPPAHQAESSRPGFGSDSDRGIGHGSSELAGQPLILRTIPRFL
jgi:hypothetical protein